MAIVNVKDFASPLSATSGIQEAIDSLPDGGGTVFIPAGTYLLRRSIRPRPGVTLAGEGPATILTRPAPLVKRLAEATKPNETRTILKDADGLQPGDEIWIGHIRQIGWHSRHLLITRVEGNVIDGEILAGEPERAYDPKEKAWAVNYFPAIWIQEADGVTISSLTIDGGSWEYDPDPMLLDFTNAAIHARSSFDVRVREVNVRRWPADGIGLQGGSGTVFGCIVEECLGIGLHPGTGIQRSIWMGNISRRNRSGLLFCRSVQNTIVANNVLLDNKESGIWGLGEPDRYNVVANNICAGNGRYGIEGHKSLGNAIIGNLCRSNSQESAGTYAGIYLEKHRDNLLVGNLCLDDQERPTQTQGLQAVSSAGENLIGNNHCPSYAAYWKSWEEIEKRIAAHEAEKKDGQTKG